VSGGHGGSEPLGFGVTAGLPRDVLEPLAREAVRLGYGSFWINDSARPGADGLADLGFVATVAPSLGLGVGVMPLDRREPAATAEVVRQLGLPLERLWLGVGSGGSDRPMPLVRDGVGELRRLLPGARIMIAALGPRMCRLAGEVGDGVLLNWAVPERIRWARERIAEGAAAAGRSGSDVAAWAYVRAAVGPDARERVRAEAERYARTPAYGTAMRAMDARFDRIGVAGTDLPGQLEPYRAALDGVVVRALPAAVALDEFLAIARAAAG